MDSTIMSEVDGTNLLDLALLHLSPIPDPSKIMERRLLGIDCYFSKQLPLALSLDLFILYMVECGPLY